VKGVGTVEIVATGLQAIAFPVLSRPPVGPREPATEELIQWGTKFYTYSLTAHLREIINGLVLLGRAENVPVANVVGRHIFEWAAHACYMNEKLTNYWQSYDWEAAWKLLTVAALGNLWVNRYGDEYPPPDAQPLEVPDPLRVSEVISAYELFQSSKYGEKQAKDTYSLLREYSHPNAACLEQYHEYSQDGHHVKIAYKKAISLLPSVNWCLIDVLRFIDSLLVLSTEQVVHPAIRQLIVEITKKALA
jgi:hypothetical protein